MSTSANVLPLPIPQVPVASSSSSSPKVGKLQLPDGGNRLFERGAFRKVKIEARRRLRAIIKSLLSERTVASNLGGNFTGANASSSSVVLFQRPPPAITVPITPPGWQKCIEQMLPTASQIGRFPVESNSLEFLKIVGLIKPYKCHSVNKIVNREAWDRYVTYRKDLLKKKSNDPEVWLALGMDKDEIESREKLNEKFEREQVLDKWKYDLNEALLFYCTNSEEDVENIMEQGLDDRRQMDVGKTYLGKGLYFTDNPRKYMEDIALSNTIMLFTVILGDCKYYNGSGDKAKDLIREPEKKSKEKRNEGDGTFDSITARPDTGVYNEYVIFDRRQCCLLYEIKIKSKSIYSTKGKKGSIEYSGARDYPPNIAWFDQQNLSYHLPREIRGYEWAFLSSIIFKKMDLAHNLELLKEMGLGDENDYEMNKSALLHYDNFEDAVNFLSGNTYREVENDSDGDSTSFDEDEDEDDQPIVKKARMFTAGSTGNITCEICCEDYEEPSRLCIPLKCSHELCEACYDTIEMKGTTLSGKEVCGIKCPFCKAIDGVIIGDCPDGQMIETLITTPCSGYENYGTIQIRYKIEKNRYQLDRTCYLPDNVKGKQVRRLLKVAWDRRLVFSIGTSVTTGSTNTLVWNIHQKTSLTGGIALHGYPDDKYLDRVLEELKDNGVE